MRRLAVLLIGVVLPLAVSAQQGGRGGPPRDSGTVSVLRPARVFDGQSMHEGWAVRVRGERIEAAGPADTVGVAGATQIDLPGTTLMPGLVEGHSHVLLHPYNETSWNDQVLHESIGVRVARATNHPRATHDRGDAGNRGDGQLRAEGIRARMARAAGGGGSRRRRSGARRPRSN